MIETATFGAGCFWGVEHTFQTIQGVVKTEVGYEGGMTTNPTYQQVCSNSTGHAEVVQIQFDPEQVTYEDLLNVFWRSHNPTTPNRQGVDIGSQYRSVVFYHSEEQRRIAEQSKKDLENATQLNIVTQIVPATTFYRAEEYHQKYHDKNK